MGQWSILRVLAEVGTPTPLMVLIGVVLAGAQVGSFPRQAYAQDRRLSSTESGDNDEVAAIFEDGTKALGLSFTHFNGMSGEFYFPEMTGQGGALFDFDNDGDLDVYLVQGAMLGPGKTLADALFPPVSPGPIEDRLFRNDLLPGRDGRPAPNFVDVTKRSRLSAVGYGMGVTTGDYDNDGWVDLYVTNYGPNQLWRNRGDGTFEDVTTASGTDDTRWSTGAAFVDIDSDGKLDLYVVNYVEFDIEKNPRCFAPSTRRDYCGPDAFRPLSDKLLRNRGDGTFEEVTHSVLVDYRPGPGLGVVAADLNGDDLPDLYVANDGKPNQLWINRGDGTFLDDALLAGVAVNREGRPEASMGVDSADFDDDGDEDLFLAHLMGETDTLFVNDGSGIFTDRTHESGLAAVSLPYTSFGTAWIDYDNDGWLDLIVVNGAVRILEEQAAAGDRYPLNQPNQLLRNQNGRFVDISHEAGEALTLPEVSRGAAVGDIDNDGRSDVLVTNSNGPARLLVNGAGDGEQWLGVNPLEASGSPATGTRVRLTTADGDVLWRRSRTDGSYCSARDPRLVLGLGSSAARSRPERLRIYWRGGPVQEWLQPPTGRYFVLRRPPERESISP